MLKDDGLAVPSAPQETPAPAAEAAPQKTPSLERIWEAIVRAGLGDVALRTATGIVSVVLILVVVWVMRDFFVTGDLSQPAQAVQAASPDEPASRPDPAALSANPPAAISGISRSPQLYTLIPTRPRNDILYYEVQPGDNIFAIAEKYNLRPETVMWANLNLLGDDPHRLLPGKKLVIMPIDGIYYEWHTGDGLNGVAKFYGVAVEDILNWPGNNLTIDAVGDFADPNIKAGTMLVIPGGRREFISWNAPYRTREEPANSTLGGGANCGEISGGPMGIGSFIWPSTETYLSGFDYSPSTNHRAIDIAGQQGNPIFAADNGVVVYSGWNDYGYGNVIVIDHGNDWQTLYAHLMDGGLNVSCGGYVTQGDVIGYMGSTGNSSGPHLHFELRNLKIGTVNPWDYLTP